MSLFEALHVEKSYAGNKVLNDVSMHVPAGSIYGLLGPNGAGKTTLIRIINHITAPDKGELFFEGQKLSYDHLTQIGYLPEERGLYKKMKVGEQSLYLARLKGLTKNDAFKKLKYWFERFEMIDWWDKKIEELSKGMAQKVQFIITVLHNPKLLIFDEPFSGFDPVNASMLKNEVLRLKENGTTVIFSTHDMASVEELCDHITLIDKSRAVLEGSVSDIKQQYKAHLFELIYTGNPENLMKELNGSFTLVHSETMEDNTNLIRIQIPANISGNTLLSAAMPHAEIHSFRELLPSMNEIFIKVVSKQTNHNE